MSDLDDLATLAHGTRVAVVGGGIAGLVTALECAQVGLQVTVLESSAALGGAIRSADVGGETLDVGADGWATSGGHVDDLVRDLGLDSARSAETPGATWISGLPGGPAPLPADTVLGIPANAWDPAVRRLVGWGGVWRAYLDRLRPPLTIGREHDLDRLVRGRMGARIVDRLVAPLSVGRHGLRPDEVDVEVAAPGIGAALTRSGSLGGAVGELLAARGPGGYATLDGGMAQLVDALAARLTELGAQVLLDTPVHGLARAADAWLVETGAEPLEADVVVVATPEAEARRLLSPLAAIDQAGDDRSLVSVTLVVDAPALDAHPRGTAVHPLPGTSRAASVVHVTARWPSLAARLGAGRHVLRVTVDPATDDPRDAAVLAAEEAFGHALDVVDARVDRFPSAPPRSAAGRLAASGRVRDALRAVEGLAVVGAWVAGSGLAQVVPDAIAEAERVRRRALFGVDPSQG